MQYPTVWGEGSDEAKQKLYKMAAVQRVPAALAPAAAPALVSRLEVPLVHSPATMILSMLIAESTLALKCK